MLLSQGLKYYLTMQVVVFVVGEGHARGGGGEGGGNSCKFLAELCNVYILSHFRIKLQVIKEDIMCSLLMALISMMTWPY